MHNNWLLWVIVVLLVLVVFILVWYLLRSVRRARLSDERNLVQSEMAATVFQIIVTCQTNGDITELMTRYTNLQEQLENIKKNNQVC
jgi:heme/copper-type cytochrome/quinol oxidase subunit 2